MEAPDLDLTPPLYQNPRGLYPFQAELVGYCYLRPKNLAVVDTGLGKGLEVGTGVLRPDGSWTPVQDLAVGDSVVGGDGLPVVVQGVYRRGRQPGYVVTTDDGVSVRVDADHLWTVATDLDVSRGIAWRTVETRVLAESVRAPGRNRWRIPVTSHRGGNTAPLPLDPYVLGALLGDGHIAGGQVALTVGDDEIAAIVKERLPVGAEFRVDLFPNKVTRYRIVGSVHRSNPVMESLRDLGVDGCRSWEKFVPKIYLEAPEEERRSLLAGLMDTDGWIGGAQQFTSTSPQLATDVAYLVRSLGGVARITSKSTSCNGKPGRTAFNVTLRLDFCPFWLQRKVDIWNSKPRLNVTRKIASITPIDGGIESVCIKVANSDGLFLIEGHVVTHNTHLALATACLLIEDDLVDMVVIFAEGNKVDEWMVDIAQFTKLKAFKYQGSKERRRNIVKNGFYGAQVIVSTYHSARGDLIENKQDGFLMEALRSRRLFVCYDEATLLAGRTSALHKAHAGLIYATDARALGLTATPVTNGPESFYNLGRIFCPDRVGSEADFFKDHVVRVDSFGRPAQFRNLDLLSEKVAPVLLRKRKTDADVKDQFPQEVEEFVRVKLSDEHQDLYDELDEMISDLDEHKAQFGFDLLQNFANHPRSILTSDAQLAHEFLADKDLDAIGKMRCAKAESVVRQVKAITMQETDNQVIVFCDSVGVLKSLHEDLVAAKVTPSIYHGGLDHNAREAAKADFKSGRTKVLLSSAAGERGINLPEASYVINFDTPLMHSSYTQRLSRASRIGSRAGEILVVKTFIAADTVEEGALRTWNRRNSQSDALIDFDVDEGDPTFVTAAARRALINESSRRSRNQWTSSQSP